MFCNASVKLAARFCWSPQSRHPIVKKSRPENWATWRRRICARKSLTCVKRSRPAPTAARSTAWWKSAASSRSVTKNIEPQRRRVKLSSKSWPNMTMLSKTTKSCNQCFPGDAYTLFNKTSTLQFSFVGKSHLASEICIATDFRILYKQVFSNCNRTIISFFNVVSTIFLTVIFSILLVVWFTFWTLWKFLTSLNESPTMTSRFYSWIKKPLGQVTWYCRWIWQATKTWTKVFVIFYFPTSWKPYAQNRCFFLFLVLTGLPNFYFFFAPETCRSSALYPSFRHLGFEIGNKRGRRHHEVNGNRFS